MGRTEMKSTKELRIILVTAPDIKIARKLARIALKERVVACANLVPGLESHYWWQGKIERSKEVLILLKTTTRKLRQLEKLILKHHPYDTPEFVVLTPTAVTERYLKWCLSSVLQR
jgi:periplasmic divalent cation tolerance protein